MATIEPSIPGRREDQTSRGIETIPRRRLLLDRWNRGLIALGGQGVILLILAMFVFLVIEAWPLAQAPRVEAAEAHAVQGTSAVVLADPYRSHVGSVSRDGVLSIVRESDGEVVLSRPLLAAAPAAETPGAEGAETPPAEPTGEDARTSAAAEGASVDRVLSHGWDGLVLLSTDDGRLVGASLAFDVRFENNERVVTPRIGESRSVTLDPSGAPVEAAAARLDDDAALWVGQLAGGEIVVHRVAVQENLFTGERTETATRIELGGDLDVAHWAIAPDQRSLYAGARDGRLAWWHLDEGGEPVEILEGEGPVTAMTLLKGGQTLAVGRADGTIANFFRIRRALSENLTRIRELAPLGSRVIALAPSDRDRSLLALGAEGDLALYYATSGRRLWAGESPLDGATAAALTPKGDAIVLGGAGRLATLEVHAPHPEVSWSTYFGKLWYEGFEKAEAIWQSTGGTDDFESKLSLLPLVFGTLKGTLYSLFLAVPIAILGAMYTSQFLHPRFQRVVKPTVEMMASLPSVVLGLVAGLWLAPRLETHFPALIAIMIATPALLVLAGFAWSRAPAALRARLPAGAGSEASARVQAPSGRKAPCSRSAGGISCMPLRRPRSSPLRPRPGAARRARLPRARI